MNTVDTLLFANEITRSLCHGARLIPLEHYDGAEIHVNGTPTGKRVSYAALREWARSETTVPYLGHLLEEFRTSVGGPQT